MILNGKKGELIDEGSRLNAEKKIIEDRLKEIKAELSELPPDKYESEMGVVIVSESEQFENIAPKTVLNYLKKNKMVSHFPDTVKVNVTALKKVVPEVVFNKWRKPKGKVKRFTFK